MSNIVPQLHRNFNDAGGLWFQAEGWLHEYVPRNSNEVWVYSGCLMHDSRFLERVGPDTNIVVPDQFYKVVIKDTNEEFPDVLVFLFPHYDNSEDITEQNIFKFLVSVDYLEAISGLDFFNEHPKEVQDKYEREIKIGEWNAFVH